MPRIATLNNKHSSNPGRSYYRAHCIVHKGRKDDAVFSSLVDCMTTYIVRPSASLTDRGARRLAAAHQPWHFFWLYICHRHLHAKFQKNWLSKKPYFFHLKMLDNVFAADCTYCFCGRLYKVCDFMNCYKESNKKSVSHGEGINCRNTNIFHI